MLNRYCALLEPIVRFLGCETPDKWIKKAALAENLPVILTDHLVCELKAAQTAVWMLKRYVIADHEHERLQDWLKPYEDYVYRQQGSVESLAEVPTLGKKLTIKTDMSFGHEMLDRLILLIKEELHHFYQVLEIMQGRGVAYQPIRASRYAKGLMRSVRTYEPAAMVDRLVIGAFIEARSCERFAALAPFVDEQLAAFYISLLRSEARHYEDYLKLAEMVSGEDIRDRVELFRTKENQLINQPDEDFKFHSGVPLN